jgi:GT2 family glycosyltransferase
MLNYNFVTECVRFQLYKENTIIFNGWFREDNPDERTLECYLDQERLNCSQRTVKGSEVRQKYSEYQAEVNEEQILLVDLPTDWEERKKLFLYTCNGVKRKMSYSASIRQLKKIKNGVDYYIEMQRLEGDSQLLLSGWCVAGALVKIMLRGKNGRELPIKIKRSYRKDIAGLFAELDTEYQAGFQLTADISREKHLEVCFQAGSKKSVYRMKRSQLKKGRGRADGVSILKKAAFYYERHGMEATLLKIRSKLFRNEKVLYEDWRKRRSITKEELERQREEKFSYSPKFSIVIPLYRTKKSYLRELLESVQRQTYGNWELCLADGSGKDFLLEPLVSEYAKGDQRIRYRALEENLGISENTNKAMDMAKGDFFIFADHDDLLSPDALYECAKALNQDGEIEVLYSDEDKIDTDGQKYFEPHFKSDLNIDLLCSMNYICHLFVVKKTLIEKSGVLRSEFDGAQDHDFILRCVEVAKKVYHIPRVLYHWRCHLNSTAANPESKLYAFEAGRKAVEEHYHRMGIPAIVEHAKTYGMFRTKYHWEEQPLISIIIPNKDHIDDLKKCMDSVLKKSSYQNFEFVIVENNSTEKETFAYYKKIESERIHIVYYEGEFNFAKINNIGVKHAKGEYLLLLNNDTEMIGEHCLEELLYPCMREDVGVVGARLYYEDDTVQHGGVIIGFGGMAGHAFIGQSRYEAGYFSRSICTQDLSAVTAACLMTKKSIFEAAGGLTEEFVVALNDIDYCLKVRALGKLVVYNPYAELYHYESKSRGLEDTPEKVERFQREVALFNRRWDEILKNGDPYYNRNLTLNKADFSLRV